jgi:predicted nucleotidyltransferase
VGVVMENISEIVKQTTIEELKKYNVEVKEFYLFGSRAKGTYREDSDWDFFVVIDKDLDTKIKRNLIQLIKRKLIHIDFPFDIIIQSASDFEKKKSDKGYLTYYVVKEGVKI